MRKADYINIALRHSLLEAINKRFNKEKTLMIIEINLGFEALMMHIASDL